MEVRKNTKLFAEKSSDVEMKDVLDVKDIYFDDEDTVTSANNNPSITDETDAETLDLNPNQNKWRNKKKIKLSELMCRENRAAIIAMIKTRQKRTLSGYISALWHGALQAVKMQDENKDQFTYADYLKALYFILLYRVGGFADYIMTYFRSYQVYSNIMANGANDPSSNPDGSFNKNIHPNGEESGLTEVGLFSFIFCLLSLPVGLALEMAVIADAFWMDSLERHREMLKENGCDDATKNILEDDNLFDQWIDERYDYFLRRKKIFNRLNQQFEYEIALNHEDANRKSIDPEIYNINNYNGEKYIKELYNPGKTFTRFFAVFNGKLALSERGRWLDLFHVDYNLDISYERTDAEIFFSGFFNVWNGLWNRINDDAFRYWLAWFLIEVPKGLAKASIGMVFAPVAVLTALLTGLIHSIPKFLAYLHFLPKSNPEIKNDQKADRFNNELFRMGKEFRYRNATKTEGRKDKEYINTLLQSRGLVTHDIKVKRGEVEEKVQLVLHRTKEKVQNTRLVQKLLRKGNGTTRMVLGMIVDAVNAIIMWSFATWIVSAAAHVFSNFNPVSTFLDAGMADAGVAVGALGIFTGIYYAVGKYHDMRVQQLDFEARIHKKMCEEYEPGITKLEYLDSLEHEVEFNKGKLEWLRFKFLINKVKELENSNEDLIGDRINDNAILKSLDTNEFKPENISRREYKFAYRKIRAEREALTKELRDRISSKKLNDGMGMEFDLDKMDIYNDEYRDNQNYTPTLYGYFKFVISYVHEFFKTIQTGSLFARTEWLVGGTFAFSATAVIGGFVPIFIPIAAACALAYGVIATTLRYLEECHQNQENFLANMDANISRLKKKNKHLGWMNDYLDPTMAPKNSSEVLDGQTPVDSLKTSTDSNDSDIQKENSIDAENNNSNKNKKPTNGKKTNKKTDYQTITIPAVPVPEINPVPAIKLEIKPVSEYLTQEAVTIPVTKLPSLADVGMFKQLSENAVITQKKTRFAEHMKNNLEEEGRAYLSAASAA